MHRTKTEFLFLNLWINLSQKKQLDISIAYADLETDKNFLTKTQFITSLNWCLGMGSRKRYYNFLKTDKKTITTVDLLEIFVISSTKFKSLS